ncbi:PD-(D/E)XK nuclease family protein [Candidatus Omnitrophota bacterium]
MSQYYNPKRKKNLYTPRSEKPYEVSRSKIDLFLNCPRCFYRDRRLGIAQPPGYPFTLNTAIDKLLKKEFDSYRKKGTTHPIMKENGLDAIPLEHESMDKWRDARKRGIKYLHTETNLILKGGIDDVWVNPQGEFIIVDYKSTSKEGEVSIDADWQMSYKRQMEVYQWLFRKNGFKVSPIGYFLYCNGNTDVEAFNGKLEFEIKLIPYEGSDSWIEKTVFDIHKCLNSDLVPGTGKDCDYCRYVGALGVIRQNELF